MTRDRRAPFDALVAQWLVDAQSDDAAAEEAAQKRLWVTAGGLRSRAQQRRDDANELQACLRDGAPDETPPGWQPIETAPEAMWVLVAVPNDGMHIASMTLDPSVFGEKGKFRGDRYRCHPTHWMPLPQPPAAVRDGAAPATEPERRRSGRRTR
jgi:hypothetical protein